MIKSQIWALMLTGHCKRKQRFKTKAKYKQWWVVLYFTYNTHWSKTGCSRRCRIKHNSCTETGSVALIELEFLSSLNSCVVDNPVNQVTMKCRCVRWGCTRLYSARKCCNCLGVTVASSLTATARDPTAGFSAACVQWAPSERFW